MPFLSFRLLLLFFRRHWGIYFQQALGKIHAHLMLRDVYAFQIRFGERYFELFACACNNQQRSFAGSELNVFDAADFTTVIQNRAADQVAYIRPALFQLRALGDRNLQFRSDQKLGVRHRIDAAKLQNQQALVRPDIFYFQFAPSVLQLWQREQLHASGESFRDVAVRFGTDLAVPALRFHDAGQGDELAC